MSRRALFFVADLGGGGAQRTMLNLAAAMPAQGLAVEAAINDTGGPARRWLDPGVTVHALGGGRLALLAPRLAGLIRRRRPAIVLSTMVDANVVAALAVQMARCGTALALRETNSHRARGDLGAVRRRLARWAYRRADLVIALSEGVRRELIADMRLDPARTQTIPNPVTVAAIAAQASAARAAPPPWAGRWRAPTIVAIGRLHRQKGFDVLLDAFAAAPGGARLVILGEGPERAALDAQARRLGLAERVWLPGFVPEPAAFLAHAALFVLSSRWEGFGHVLVEAMAAGVPVVSTDCPYGPADILRHGETGLLVPPDDAASLSAAIDTVLGDASKASALAAAGVVAAHRFEAARVAGEYAAALQAAISRRADARRPHTMLPSC